MQPIDLNQDGIAAAELRTQKRIVGRVGDDEVLLVEDGEKRFAVGSKCPHYNLPLKDGRIVDGHIICPFHQSCFRLADGELLRAPAMDPIKSYEVSERDGRIFVSARRGQATATAPGRHPASVSIVGAGAAGFAALVGLRHAGYEGPITIFGAEADRPYDRVKLSKAYLTGGVADDKLPLVSKILEHDEGTHWRLDTPIDSIDTARRVLVSKAGEHPFHTLILATGATPRSPDLPGAELPHVFVLRTLRDAQRIRRALGDKPKKIGIIGAGFIGLEAAAQLTQKGFETHVIAPQGPPMANIVGQALAEEIERTHAQHGTHFHFGQTLTRIAAQHVVLSDNTQLRADVVLLAMGVEPNVRLAKQAHLEVGDGVLVDEHLRTSARDIFAIGDCASWPLKLVGSRVRIEHWAVAGEMGLVVADNVLGHARTIDHVPFFWSEQFDIKLRYVGHARRVERAQVIGDLKARRAAIILFESGQPRAVLTLGRDDLAMLAHEAFAHGSGPKLPELLARAG